MANHIVRVIGREIKTAIWILGMKPSRNHCMFLDIGSGSGCPMNQVRISLSGPIHLILLGARALVLIVQRNLVSQYIHLITFMVTSLVSLAGKSFLILKPLHSSIY